MKTLPEIKSIQRFGVFFQTGLDIWVMSADISHDWTVTEVQNSLTSIDFAKTHGLFAIT